MAQTPGPGRPRRYCTPSHRQRSYEARRRAAAFDLPAGEVIVAEEELRRLHDRLYRLEAAVEDVDGDLRSASGPAAVRSALDHLLDAARDLVGVVVEPARP